MSKPPPLRIGTRGSRLALVQTEAVRTALVQAHPQLAEAGAVEIHVIRTTGDRITDRPLAEVGGKGLFVKEIQEALLADRIDLAVHSMKDVETRLPPGLKIGCYLPREDPRDVLIADGAGCLADLAQGVTFGTASLRRQAQVLAARPDLRPVLLRGNVHTRIERQRSGEVGATLLALAGLRRLGIGLRGWTTLGTDEILPAVGQGAIGIEFRRDDSRAEDLLAPLNDDATATCVVAERAMLDRLDGTCRTPIAGLATLDGATITLRGLLARPDGAEIHRAAAEGSASDPEALGRKVGDALIAAAGRDFIRSLG